MKDLEKNARKRLDSSPLENFFSKKENSKKVTLIEEALLVKEAFLVKYLTQESDGAFINANFTQDDLLEP